MWTFRYDYENRLIEARGTDLLTPFDTNVIYEFGYDGLGRRVLTRTDGVESWFVYDGDQLVQQWTPSVLTNAPEVEYAWGPTVMACSWLALDRNNTFAEGSAGYAASCYLQNCMIKKCGRHCSSMTDSWGWGDWIDATDDPANVSGKARHESGCAILEQACEGRLLIGCGRVRCKLPLNLPPSSRRPHKSSTGGVF